MQQWGRDERKREILKTLSQKNRVSVKELSKKMMVSMETVRQDLAQLAAERVLKKVHGGAVQLKEPGLELYFSKRQLHYRVEKESISQKALEYISPGETIAIGSGTTLLTMVELLKTLEKVTVVTSSIPVLNQLVVLESRGDFCGEIYFIGGKVNSDLLSVSGSLTEKMLKDIYVDKFFFSCDAMTEEGVYVHNANEALLTQLYLKHAAEKILLVDHSKLNQKSFMKIANFSKIDRVITNSSCSKKYEEMIKETGVEWIQV